MNNLIYYKDRYKIAIRSRIKNLIRQGKYQKWFSQYKEYFADKKGLEIGGPSALFAKKYMPVYEWVMNVDGCNFSNNTLWEGTITDSQYKYFGNKTGRQYILEGTDLREITDNQYDFLLSSHNLEHIANPLKALGEWKRILKKGGVMLIVLPDKRFIFDRHRPYTSFKHLLEDYNNNTQEDDLTHLEEVLRLHDMRLDPMAGRDYEAFAKRSRNNLEHRGIHHHVYSHSLMQEAFSHIGMQVIGQYFIPPYHQISIAKK